MIMWIIILLIVFPIVGIILVNSHIEKTNEINKGDMDVYLNLIKDPEHIFIDKEYRSAVALDEKNKRILHIKTDSMSGSTRTYKKEWINFDDIIESEVVIDDETVTKTARGSQIGGAVVGGVLLGGVGAIVGGLSGKTKSKDEVKNIDMKITVNNMKNPVHRINFLHNFETMSDRPSKNGHKKDSEEYKNAIAEVEKWQGIMEVVLKGQ